MALYGSAVLAESFSTWQSKRHTGGGNGDDIEVAEANRGRHAAPLPCL